MIFEQNKSITKLGERVGYIFAYFVFTTILFFILGILNKIPVTWSYFHIMAVAFIIALTGIVIKWLLK